MLLMPSDKPFDYRQPPRLSLGLAALLLLLFIWLIPTEINEQHTLSDQYGQELLELEWPLYPTHLLQSQQTTTLDKLNQAYEEKNNLVLTQQIGFDRRFVNHLNNMGENYLEPEQVSQWKAARETFDKQRDQLSSQILGLDPQRIRPITFLTYAFMDSQSLNVLFSVLLLLMAGMAVEWALGSGALLSAWVLGSILTGVIYQLSHLNSVTPLLGSSGAISGVLGLTFMCFRHKSSLLLIGTQLKLNGWLFLVLFALLVVVNYLYQGKDITLVVAQLFSFASGFIVYMAYQRWFSTTESTSKNVIIEDENIPQDLEYREYLHNVLTQITAFEFRNAEELLRDIPAQYMNDKRVQEILYHLSKNQPESLEFEELACSLFNQANHPTNNQVMLRIYNDYKKRTKSFVALDANTCLQLAIRFARMPALKEAEEIFQRAQTQSKNASLLKKAALSLEQAFLAQQQEQKAHHYHKIANQP